MIEIGANHPLFIASSHLQEFAKPLLRKFDLNFFQYIKVFKDGSVSCSTNNYEWLKFCNEHYWAANKPVVFSSPPKTECLDPDKFCFLWEPNLPEEIVGCGRAFNLHHGITFVERTADYYTMMGFAAPSTNHSAINTYLNNIPVLMQFLEKFKIEHKDLIGQLDNNRIIVPESQHDQNLAQMFATHPNSPRHLIQHGNINSYITKMESSCIQLLAKGYTCKQIAQQLRLSPRTVETYLNRIKQRFNLFNRQELVSLWQSAALASVCQ